MVLIYQSDKMAMQRLEDALLKKLRKNLSGVSQAQINTIHFCWCNWPITLK